MNNVRVYLAHNFSAREFLRPIADELGQMGVTVTSRWVKEESHVVKGNAAESAAEDLEDISDADAVFLFVDQYGDRPGKGKWFEFGYAVALNIPVFLIGSDTSCVFTHLQDMAVYRHDTWQDAVQALKIWTDAAMDLFGRDLGDEN